MEQSRHFILSVFLSLFIIIFGTIGYVFIEDWNLIDALYMTIITLATVGFKEVHEISQAGRLYTIILIMFGAGTFIYVGTALMQFVVEGQIRIVLGRRRLDSKIKHLKNHYIICGYGRIGRVLAHKLKNSCFDLVVIDNDPEKVAVMEEDKILYLTGSATDETVLLKAGIKKATGLIAALRSDIENVFLVLTARQLSPELNIIARCDQEESMAKLKLAGADTVESPYEIGATNMALRILRPAVTNFLDLAFASDNKDIQMEEIPVKASSKLKNIMLKDSGIRQNYDLIIIAIKKPDGKMLFNPSFETKIKAGDTVIAVGEDGNLQQLEKELNPSKSLRE